jgi:ribose 5-phosphate isomerase A
MSPVEPFAGLQWPTDIIGSDAKQALAERAARRVIAALADASGPAPRIGLGSGSTAFLTLLALSEARRDLPSDVALVATSYEMEWYATAAGFPVVDLGEDGVVVAFDGADQVDPEGALIKGRGGAMHRERAVLDAARLELIVADATKRVARLGGCPLPLVLRPEGIFGCVDAVESFGVGTVAVRAGTGKDGPVLTESGGVLADLIVPSGVVVTAGLDGRIRSVSGVMDTGYFAPSPKREFVADHR